MYQEYDVDSTALSQAGWPSGEIKVSVSTDNGLTWSVGTNITNTVTPSGAPPGQCLSEAWPSMAEKVDGYCHILYVMDYDAGAFMLNEGAFTFNPMIYHKVSVDDIPTTPIVDNLPFHVSHTTPPASTDPPGPAQPKIFDLYQNTPNPFNPRTSIQFSLESVSEIDLSVYNLQGDRIATLVKGTYAPGKHTIEFDGSQIASGVYIYRLEADNRSIQRKMTLIK
jgi:hypothetical protein